MKVTKMEYWQKAKELAARVGASPEEADRFLNPDDEPDLVFFIKKYLRTPEQKTWLDQNDISIQDVLNGRTESQFEDKIQELFNSWNEKCGFHQFGFWD